MIRLGGAIWLCLHFPRLALEIFERESRDDARPLVVVEQQRVVAVDAAAAARGLDPGMALNTAHALCPGLLALERQPQREQEALQHLAHWAYGVGPELGIAANNSLLLEIGACRRLYGGIAPLLGGVRDELRARGHAIALGVAHTRKAAWLLAQCNAVGEGAPPALTGAQLDRAALQRQLGAVPVEQLAIASSAAGALGKMGIRTLGELAALPLAALGKRFGVEFIRYLQQTLGTHPDPQPAFVPLPRFQAGLSFVDGVHNRQALLFPMRRLLQALCDYLQSRQLLCTALHWELHDAHAPQAMMTVELMRAEGVPGQHRLRGLLELSELKLQAVPLHQAVYTLVLRSADFVPAQPGSPQLFADDDIGPADAFAALVDKLRARLGGAALEHVLYRPQHWPEAASTLQSIALPAATSSTDGDALPASPRPLWLLPQPQPLRVRDAKLFWHSPLKILRGPERLDNHWWEEKPATRDYYVASATDGRLCWIFRDTGSDDWFLHGLFA